SIVVSPVTPLPAREPVSTGNVSARMGGFRPARRNTAVLETPSPPRVAVANVRVGRLHASSGAVTGRPKGVILTATPLICAFRSSSPPGQRLDPNLTQSC